jgi:DNA-binding transcriptional regulator YiaG
VTTMTDLKKLHVIPALPIPGERTRLRKRFGVSQQTLANSLSVSRKTIARWETGISEPTGENRNQYAAILVAWSETEQRENE